MSKIVKAENICFAYEGETPEEKVEALKDVSFEIEEGSFVAVLGRNGSGKSTLAKLLCMINAPDSGKLTVDGVEVTSEGASEEDIYRARRNVGMVFQNPDNQIVATIVEEDVAFGPENLGLPSEKIRHRVDEALETVGMTKYARHSAARLSGGQKQRIAIAGVIAMRRKCIIFDESTAMLDPLGRREVMETVQRLHREEGMTVVLITHFMEEALRGDRVIVMEKGKTVMEGTPREVFTKVETLKGIGLDVPPMTELAHRLNKHGVELDESLMTVEEMVEELCRLKQKI